MKVPTGAKESAGGDDRYGALAYSSGPLIFCVNAMTNSQNWKPSTPEKHIRNLDPSYRYRSERAGVLRRAPASMEGSQIPLRETSFVYTRREAAGRSGRDWRMELPIRFLWKSAQRWRQATQ
ncbi:hypothetical protein ACLK19_02240 [Escherichia coli]